MGAGQGRYERDSVSAKIELDGRKLTDALVRLEKACDALPQMAQTVQGEALGHAIVGANRSVYQTTPGAYQRTYEYLRGFQATARATKNTVRVTVWNAVEYAPYIEYGVGPHEMTPAQVLAHAAANPAAPVYLGRSGQNFTLPGPAVWPAAYYAGWKLQGLFVEQVKSALR